MDGYQKRVYAHRAVAQAFLPNPGNLRTVNHKDFNKRNNFVDNLEWASYKHNLRHAIDGGHMGIGEARPNARLTEADVRMIRACDESVTDNDLARKLGVSNTVVRLARIGWTWRHVLPAPDPHLLGRRSRPPLPVKDAR